MKSDMIIFICGTQKNFGLPKNLHMTTLYAGLNSKGAPCSFLAGKTMANGRANDLAMEFKAELPAAAGCMGFF